MQVTLIMVETADGKTTLWHEPEVHGWSSDEDLTHFRDMIKKNNLIVMGRKTYESVKSDMQLTPHKRRIVMTRHPKTYLSESVPGQLEFTNDSPEQLIRRLESEGHAQLLLVGGSETNEAFLMDKLISDCWITIEPKFFGTGKSLFDSANVHIPLTLLSHKELNSQGTLLLHYTISYEHTTC